MIYEDQAFLARYSCVYDMMWLGKDVIHKDPLDRTPLIRFIVTSVVGYGPYRLGKDEIFLHSNKTGWIKAKMCGIYDL